MKLDSVPKRNQQPWPAIDAKWPVIAAPKVLAKLLDKVGELDTPNLTAYAKRLGITPPEIEGSDHWPIASELTADGNFVCLVWADPDEDVEHEQDPDAAADDWPTAAPISIPVTAMPKTRGENQPTPRSHYNDIHRVTDDARLNRELMGKWSRLRSAEFEELLRSRELFPPGYRHGDSLGVSVFYPPGSTTDDDAILAWDTSTLDSGEMKTPEPENQEGDSDPWNFTAPPTAQN